MKKTLLLVLVIWTGLTACDQQQQSDKATPIEPPFPSLTTSQLLELNKNERAELQRRCLGVSNKTCTDFKSDSFKRTDDALKALCDTSNLVSAQLGSTRNPDCEKYR